MEQIKEEEEELVIYTEDKRKLGIMKKNNYKRLTGKLVDGNGNPFANQTIGFNINGVFYNRITNENGEARLNINLMAGEYIITSSYNGCNIANTIKITA